MKKGVVVLLLVLLVLPLASAGIIDEWFGNLFGSNDDLDVRFSNSVSFDATWNLAAH